MKNVLPLLLLCIALPAGAQHQSPHDGHAHGNAQPHTHSPYAGLASREIKSLSEQQLADLRAGRGMGFALAAELNGYPGPLHALELAKELHLSRDQEQQVNTLFDAMKTETQALGTQLIDREAGLDKLFRDRKATPELVQDAAERIGLLQGRLRAAHLLYHLKMMEVLSPDQVKRYGELRGY